MIIKAPDPYPEVFPTIFLGGSIEMGKAELWQDRVAAALDSQDVLVLNPRREDWDSSWEQSIENDQFRQQVEWEIEALGNADIRLFYFDPITIAPITLFELGHFMNSERTVVCCPTGYWRKGNVDVYCSWYGIPVWETVEEMIMYAKKLLKRAGVTV